MFVEAALSRVEDKRAEKDTNGEQEELKKVRKEH